MASVCGGTLALMDAGIPIKTPVAGIAMGLIKEGDRLAVLSDILGDEDHLGDMDFKICGTKTGVTAVQMDIKIDGLTREILDTALRQAKEGRMHILGKMAEALAAPREEMSQYAPRIHTLRVKPDQIREIIGPGGKTIRGITAQTGVAIEVEDDGTVHIASPDGIAVQKAIDIIKGLTTEPEVGEYYMGVVKRLAEFGAFVEILPGTDGLVHISELDQKRVQTVQDVCKEGDEMLVKVIAIDRATGKIRLSRRANHRRDPRHRPQLPRRRVVDGAAMTDAPRILYRRLRPTALAPRYMSAGAAGLDLASAADEAITVAAGGARRRPHGPGLRDPGGVRGTGPAALGARAQGRDHDPQRARDDRQRLPRRGPGAARQFGRHRRTSSNRVTASRSSSSRP